MSKCKNCKYKQKVLRKVITEYNGWDSIPVANYTCPACGMLVYVNSLTDKPNYCTNCGIGFFNKEKELY
jgi:DNA-directed RNA polymerase subunit RPC12/RpoP